MTSREGLPPDQLSAAELAERFARFRAAQPERPDLRRPEPATPQIITVRVDLVDAAPPIWRRLELRSDLTLHDVHEVLQAAYAWYGYHLWRFSAGGSPWDAHSQLFLCAWDAEEGEDDGLPATDVRLGELLQKPKESLRYIYDYGDHWELRIVVEQVREATDDDPPARATGGRRAAPPEDSGGIRTAEDLAEVLEDPAHLDLDEVNAAISAAGEHDDPTDPAGASSPLGYLLRKFPMNPALLIRASGLTKTSPQPPDALDWDHALGAVRWLLQKAAADGGLPLTSAGYLRPADVEQLCALLPSMNGWIGTRKREANAIPALSFREALQRTGLLRKRRGALHPGAAARTALREETVPEVLVSTLVPEKEGFDRDATIMLLLHTATAEPGAEFPYSAVADDLTDLGWQVEGEPLPWFLVRDLPAASILEGIGDTAVNQPDTEQPLTAEAIALARSAVTREPLR